MALCHTDQGRFSMQAAKCCSSVSVASAAGKVHFHNNSLDVSLWDAHLSAALRSINHITPIMIGMFSRPACLSTTKALIFECSMSVQDKKRYCKCMNRSVHWCCLCFFLQDNHPPSQRLQTEEEGESCSPGRKYVSNCDNKWFGNKWLAYFYLSEFWHLCSCWGYLVGV